MCVCISKKSTLSTFRVIIVNSILNMLPMGQAMPRVKANAFEKCSIAHVLN